MKDFFILIRLYLKNTFGINKALHTKGGKGKLVLFAVLWLFLLLLALAMSLGYSQLIISILNGEARVAAPSLMFAASCLAALFTTLYKANGMLFAFGDYEMITALPLKERSIVASRLSFLYAMNVCFSAVLIVPSAIIYAVNVGIGSVAYYTLTTILLTLLAPVLPVIIATALSVLISASVSRSRHKNALTIVFSFAAMMLYFWVISRDFDPNAISATALNISNTLVSSYPLSALFIDALCYENIMSLLVFCVGSIALLAIYIVVIAKLFKRLNTTVRASQKSSGKAAVSKERSPFMSLYFREIKRYFSIPMYIMNTAVGLMIAFAMSILVLIGGKEILGTYYDPAMGSLFDYLLPFVLSFFVALCCTTASSFSLEGKQLWLLKSLPVSAKDIIRAKCAMNLSMTVPVSIICAFLMNLGFKPDPVVVPYLFALPLLYTFFTTLLGALVGMRFPMLDWETPTRPIKQGAATMIATFAGMILTFLPAFLTSLTNLVLPIMAVFLAIADIVLLRLADGKTGITLWRKIGN